MLRSGIVNYQNVITPSWPYSVIWLYFLLAFLWHLTMYCFITWKCYVFIVLLKWLKGYSHWRFNIAQCLQKIGSINIWIINSVKKVMKTIEMKNALSSFCSYPITRGALLTGWQYSYPVNITLYKHIKLLRR